MHANVTTQIEIAEYMFERKACVPPALRPEEVAAFVERIDPIDPNIVGGMRVLDISRSAPKFVQSGANLLREGAQMPLDPDESAVSERLTKKGYTDKVCATAATALLHLMSASNLYSELPPRAGTRNTFRMAAAFAEKKDGKLRVISDCRYLNAHCLTTNYHFELFSLKSYLRVLGNMASHDTWYAVNSDLRHMFHQMPLPASLRPNFVFRFDDPSSPHTTRRLVPNGVPMGWVLAPYIAQCCSWGLVLADITTQPRFDCTRLGLTAAMVAMLKSLSSPPALIPLLRGGMIVVLLDNILVITPDESVARAWQTRLATVAQRFHAIFKQIDFHVLSRDNDESFVFSGIRVSHGHRNIDVDAGDLMPGFDETGAWRGSHRDLARVMGKLLWYHRVYETCMFDSEMQIFSALYSRCTPPANVKWSDSSPDLLTAEEVAYLHRMWSARAEMAPTANLTRIPAVLVPAFAACDASLTRIGIVRFDSRDVLDGKRLAPPRAESSETQQCTSAGHPIAVVELLAIDRAVLALQEADLDANVFIVATDNLNAKAWVEHQVAPNLEGNKILARLFARLRSDQRVVLAYICSAGNAADPASRGGSVLTADTGNAARIMQTAALLQLTGATVMEEHAHQAGATALPVGKARQTVRRDREG